MLESEKNMTNTIQCGLYDHFEIACMRLSQVSVELHNGETVVGIARNLETKEGKEFLLLNGTDGVREINLMDIDVLEFVKSGDRISIS